MARKKFLLGLSILTLVLVLLFMVSVRLSNAGRLSLIAQAVKAHPKYHANVKAVQAIALHESDKFTSNVFRKCKNPFGLKTFSVTNCKAPASEDPPGKPLYYAQFATIQQATNAILSWAERRGVPAGLSDEDFIRALLARGYATDKNYLKKVKRYL
jgi:hypothetical protein